MILTWLSGIWQLRDPLLVNYMGEKRFHLRTIANIQKQYPGAKVHPDVVLISYKKERLSITETSIISQGTILAFGDRRSSFGNITIGRDSWIGQYNNLRAGGGDITIGSHCLVSQYCTLVAANHACLRGGLIKEQGSEKKRQGVVLEDDVWLGAGVSVMPGVKVSCGAIVGANSVVTHSVPAYEIWGGVPARKIGERV